jgi:histidinol-phosphate/aromatic aminotransferase/cobyric acid decarboxylase-like protein
MQSRSDELLEAHHSLDFQCRHRDGRLFISDWYCDHPYVDHVMRAEIAGRPAGNSVVAYYFQNDDLTLHHQIVKFHANHGERDYGPEQVFVSAGLSSLITAQIMLLARRGVRKLYYVRPLYYTYYFLAQTLGIELVAVNDAPAIESGAPLELPAARGEWLIVCDPVWFLGKSASADAIDNIRQWQQATGGMVLVDGAFQYQRWAENNRPEESSRLVLGQTLRNLCPTKAVAVHGPRFAYSLIPAEFFEELRYCYANTAGSGSAFDRDAAVRIMAYLNARDSNTRLVELMSARYRFLQSESLIDDPVGADASYFCFVRTPVPRRQMIVMDQTFFDIDCFPDLVRMNLLLPLHTLVPFIRLAAEVRGTSSKVLKRGLIEAGIQQLS